jgi:hypothetical protein
LRICLLLKAARQNGSKPSADFVYLSWSVSRDFVDRVFLNQRTILELTRKGTKELHETLIRQTLRTATLLPVRTDS